MRAPQAELQVPSKPDLQENTTYIAAVLCLTLPLL